MSPPTNAPPAEGVPEEPRMAQSSDSENGETVGDIGERRLVALISEIASPTETSVHLGIGDDAALLAVPPGHDFVVSCDAVPQDLFAWDTGLINHRELG